MSDTILRQLEMLRLLPHWPKKVDSSALCTQLVSEGYKVSKRTVQRDLQSLSTIFPIICDEVPGQFGWSWSRDVAPLTINSMPPHIAIAFKLAEKYLQSFLPSHTYGHLKEYFKIASHTLISSKDVNFPMWEHKIGSAQRSHRFIEPTIITGVTATIYTALFEGLCLEVSYCTAQSSKEKHALISPQGILIRDPVIYLLCTFNNYQDVRQLAFHRIKQAKLTDKQSIVLKNFAVDTYITDYSHDLLVEGEIELKLKVSDRQLVYLIESPLSKTQVIQQDDDGSNLLEVTLHDTIQLRRWILSITGDVEVLKPLYLREYHLNKIKSQLQQYGL